MRDAKVETPEEGTGYERCSRIWKRLPAAAYRGRVAAMYTVRARGGVQAFLDEDTVRELTDILAEAATKHSCTIPVYTFMPNHIHVLAVGESEEADSLAMMQRFKLRAGKWFDRTKPKAGLQKRFYDRVIKDRAGWEREAWYIANNPVRAKLVEDAFDWPHTGAIGCELDAIRGFRVR